MIPPTDKKDQRSNHADETGGPSSQVLRLTVWGLAIAFAVATTLMLREYPEPTDPSLLRESQEAAVVTSNEELRNSEPALRVNGWNWKQSSQMFVTAEGQVTNLSSDPLSHVQVVVTWTDETGRFVTSEDALIEYQPLLPGQTAPFKVVARHNPAMASAGIDFKFLAGPSIKWVAAP